jgi:hypothetical protein
MNNTINDKAQNLQFTLSKEKIHAFQILALKELKELTLMTNLNDPERLSRLFLCQMSMKKLNISIIEEIFFVGLIGKFLMLQVELNLKNMNN